MLKMSKSKKVFSLLLGCFILIGAFIACGGSDSNTGTLADANSSNNSKSTPAASTKFHVGDAVKVGDKWNITINEVKTMEKDGDFHAPQKEGNVFLAINVTAENTAAEEQDISSALNFSLKGSDGTKYNQTILTTESPAPDGKIEVGGKQKGVLAYEVAGSEKNFILSFAPDLLSDGQTQWELTVS
jgi:hypothetical protein